jgi:hypothetical protein
LIDFLFSEILSAPTATAQDKIAETPKIDQPIPFEVKRGRRTLRVQRLNSMTRLVPPSLYSAHDRARDCIADILDVTKKRVNEESQSFLQSRQRLSQMRSSITQRVSVINKEQIRPSESTTAPKAVPIRIQPTLAAKNLRDYIEACSVDDLYLDLLTEIHEQRTSAKKSLQESIDSVWGYISFSILLALLT